MAREKAVALYRVGKEATVIDRAGQWVGVVGDGLERVGGEVGGALEDGVVG